MTAIASLLGKIPTKAEYLEHMKTVQLKAADIYRYMNFHKMPEFKA